MKQIKNKAWEWFWKNYKKYGGGVPHTDKQKKELVEYYKQKILNN